MQFAFILNWPENGVNNFALRKPPIFNRLNTDSNIKWRLLERSRKKMYI